MEFLFSYFLRSRHIKRRHFENKRWKNVKTIFLTVETLVQKKYGCTLLYILDIYIPKRGGVVAGKIGAVEEAFLTLYLNSWQIDKEFGLSLVLTK